MSMSEEKRMLLFKGAQKNGVVGIEMAENLYSSKSQGKSAITSLEFQGYLKKHVPGYFKIKKLPRNVKERLDELEEDESDSESDYVEEEVDP